MHKEAQLGSSCNPLRKQAAETKAVTFVSADTGATLPFPSVHGSESQIWGLAEPGAAPSPTPRGGDAGCRGCTPGLAAARPPGAPVLQGECEQQRGSARSSKRTRQAQVVPERLLLPLPPAPAFPMSVQPSPRALIRASPSRETFTMGEAPECRAINRADFASPNPSPVTFFPAGTAP